MGCTPDNLQDAFAGESQANRRYLFFADKAEAEGYSQVARLFRAAAEAETVHAHNHLEVMGGIRSSRENLEEAVKGESYEFMTMYPKFIEHAKSDNNQRAEISFTHANAVEKIHHNLYQKALEALEKGQQPKDEPYFVCQVCGNTVAGEAPEKCPICGAPRSKFRRVE
ncbi:rubrerythrin family protein [Chloroflexota bacterium]